MSDEAEKWKSEDDMYGWNFHQGMSSGTIEASIIYHRVIRGALAKIDAALARLTATPAPDLHAAA